MHWKWNKVCILSMFIFYIAAINVLASPELSIPANMTVSGTHVQMPVKIFGVSGAGINAYKVRIDYDETKLSNPQLLLDDTLSEGKNVQSGPPQDGKGGDYIIALLSGFSANVDGILANIQLDVDTSFTFSEITIVTAETALLNAAYQEIAYTKSDGILMHFESGFENNVVSIGKTDHYEIKIAQDDMLTMETSSFDNNGFVFAGHDNGNMSFDTTAPDEYDLFLSRTWCIKAHANSPETITLTFTIPKIDEPISYFGLLASSDNSSLTGYEELDRIEPGYNTKNTLVFTVSSDQLIDNQYFTLGLRYGPVQSIPTLNEWGIVFFMGLILLISISRIKYKVLS